MINKSKMRKISIIAEMAWSHDGSASKAIKLLELQKFFWDISEYILQILKPICLSITQNSPGKVSQGKKIWHLCNA